MKLSLQLRLGQQLTMTPQLQQAIRLLQLSTLDLQAEVQELLEANPMLEQPENSENGSQEAEWESSGDAGSEGGGDLGQADATVESKGDQAESTASQESLSDSDNSKAEADTQLTEIPEDLPVDSNWDDVYDVPTTSSTYSDQDNMSFEAQATDAGETLQEHLLWQLRLTPFSDSDRIIAEAIIDGVIDDGYLSVTLESILEGFQEEMPDMELAEAEAVLRRIQSFDPLGVAARDLRECLLLQLGQCSKDDATINLARKLVANYLELLASRDYTQLMRRLKLDKVCLQEVVEIIQALNPRPGNAIAPSRTQYVIPDVVVKKVRNKWLVELNSDALPKLRINSFYAGLIKRADNSQENTFLKNNLQEARWFIKSLQSRNETLLKVATCIVERQRGFLEHGEEAMKALVLHDVAETVSMHESTISRVTNQKYMHTPRGIFELKYFFSSHVSTASGGACSATAIRALIKKLVAAENVTKPLSDSKIAGVLSDQGINVARRTVAKYREAMSIPPSNERKRLA